MPPEHQRPQPGPNPGPNPGLLPGAHLGRVRETLYYAGSPAVRIACRPAAAPAPGQYLLALPAGAAAAPPFGAGTPPLALPLFAAGGHREGSFLAAPPAPAAWGPGTELALRGPFGTPFRLPAGLRRLALAALGESVARLMPLVEAALEAGSAVTLYTAAPLPPLPAAVEALPLEALPEAPAWADFMALDLPLEALPGLRLRLGLDPGAAPACPAQALVHAPMPCGGLGQCGACAVEGRRGWLLACEDGPVFDLSDLRY